MALFPDEILPEVDQWTSLSPEQMAAQVAQELRIAPMNPIPVFLAGLVGGAIGGAVAGKAAKSVFGVVVLGGVAWGAYYWMKAKPPEVQTHLQSSQRQLKMPAGPMRIPTGAR